MARVKEELRKTKAKEEKERKEKQERDLAARKLTAEVARGRTKEAGLKAEAEAAGRRLKALRDDILKITDAAAAGSNLTHADRPDQPNLYFWEKISRWANLANFHPIGFSMTDRNRRN